MNLFLGHQLCAHCCLLLLQFWDVIQLLDMRDVKSTDEMFEACLDHLDKANSSGVTEAYITVPNQACNVSVHAFTLRSINVL